MLQLSLIDCCTGGIFFCKCKQIKHFCRSGEKWHLSSCNTGAQGEVILLSLSSYACMVPHNIGPSTLLALDTLCPSYTELYCHPASSGSEQGEFAIAKVGRKRHWKKGYFQIPWKACVGTVTSGTGPAACTVSLLGHTLKFISQ